MSPSFSVQAAIAMMWLLSGITALADGKMYSEKVNAKIPYQRALIVFDEGNQTMVLQSQYEIPGEPGNHKLGWVVPVPAVPVIHSIDAGVADWLFYHMDRMTSPHVVSVSLQLAWLGVVAFLFGIVLFIASLFPYFLTRRSRMQWIAFLCVSLSVVYLLGLPMFLRQSKSAGGVEVVQAGKAGIYDTMVIRADSAADLVAWFNAHSFQFDTSDEVAIQSYIDRGWHFVTATVDASIDPENRAAVSGNLLAPLILHFPTPTPVYPTALTATGGHPTEILIYLATKGPMQTRSDLKLRFSGEVANRFAISLFDVDPEMQDEMLEFLPMPFEERIHMSKFKSTLSPAQMVEDIEFLPAPDAPPFRERVYRW